MKCDLCGKTAPKLVTFGNTGKILCPEDASKLLLTLEFAEGVMKYMEEKLQEFNREYHLCKDGDLLSRRFLWAPRVPRPEPHPQAPAEARPAAA